MVLTDLREQGITRLRTRRQRLRRTLHIALALAAAVGSIAVGHGIASLLINGAWAWPHVTTRPLLVGSLLHAETKGSLHLQCPAILHFAVPTDVALTAAIPLWGLGLLVQIRLTRQRRHPGLDRHRGLATLKSIRQKYGTRAVRRTGRFALPGTSRSQRWLLPTESFGYRFGSPLRPHAPHRRLWFNYETRLRVVARTGWGKSWRLLIPLIRHLPGPAVITSVEPEIFAATVKARTLRLPPVRWRWMRLLRRRWRTPIRYPVVVADLSDPETRMASGFPEVRRNPIVGCQNYKVAANRARALVSGGDSQVDSNSATDKFFRDSAAQVLAAWLHAAALDDTKDIEDIVEWLRDTDLNTPTSTLEIEEGPGFAAAQSAIMNMNVHLDPAAGRTTSGVRRYLNFAISSMSSGPGRTLCGDRHGPQTDIEQLIRDQGSIYLLAEVDEMEQARPLLTLFAQEMFLAAERVARRSPGRRLPETFMGVFDELYAGVRVPILPYVAAVQRKYGISFAYAVQSSMDEDDMYGRPGAQRLRTQCHTIIGGYDPESAQETTRRAGPVSTVSATRGSKGHRTEQGHSENALPESDQQELRDGDSVILGLGIKPFLTHTHRADHQRCERRTIGAETRAVDRYLLSNRAQYNGSWTEAGAEDGAETVLLRKGRP